MHSRVMQRFDSPFGPNNQELTARFPAPNRHLIIEAGKWAKAEQMQLVDGQVVHG